MKAPNRGRGSEQPKAANAYGLSNSSFGKSRGCKKTNIILLTIAVLLEVTVVCLCIRNGLSAGSKVVPAIAQPSLTQVEHKYPGYKLKSALETVLVVGVDKFAAQTDTNSYNNDQQSDFLMLFVFNDAAKTVQAIPIDRNTMTDVMVLGVRGEKVGYEKMQIALSHTYGTGENDSRRNTVDAASRLLNDVEIDHYIFLTMDAIPIVNDLCGGVTVKLDDDFSFINDAMTEGAEYTLLGDEALMYLRARTALENDANTARMARQNKYLQALYEKLVSVPEDNNKDFIVKLTAALSDYMESDCSVTQLDSLFDRGQSYDNLGILSIKGKVSHDGEFTEFYADAEDLQDLVKDIFYEKAK